MSVINDNQDHKPLLEARESFSGRLLTDNQFDEAIAITHIMENEIRKSGTFKEKLGDYAHAFSRTEKFDAMKGEETIRDLFKARTGQTMNQMREALIERESKLLARETPSSREKNTRKTIKSTLSEAEKDRAYQRAADIGNMIQDGDKMSFYRAYTHQASELAKDLDITESGAKRLMQEQFQDAENRNLYDWGKELEEEYYRPQIEAEQQARQQSRAQKPSRQRKR